MTFLQACILGLVEGITEFLPISSTGHLIVTSRLLGVTDGEFARSFDIAIQLGAIFAVVMLYARTLVLNWKVLTRVFAAFIPTATLGLIFYKTIKHFLLGSETVVIVSLFLGGVFLIFFEKAIASKPVSKTSLESISFRQAVLVGLFQSISMIPGVSRAAATIVGGLWLGLPRKTIVEFSFLLAVPTMLAATALDLLKTEIAWTPRETGLLATGILVSFFVAMIAIRFLLRFIQKHDFKPFGYYRIAAACLFWFLLK